MSPGESFDLQQVNAASLKELCQISAKTFNETFAGFNAAEDMAHYIENAFSPAKLLAELTNPESRFFSAQVENQWAGYLKINTGQAQTEKHDPGALEIERIYVLSEFQGKQIGKKLMEKAVEIAESETISTIWLGVWENNLKAIEFYRKNGFTVFGEHIFRLGNDEQRDVLMHKLL